MVTSTAPGTTTEQKKWKYDWLTLGFVRYRNGLPVDKRASEEEHVEKTFASTGHISKYGHLRDPWVPAQKDPRNSPVHHSP